jgi:hypothetical protein
VPWRWQPGLLLPVCLAFSLAPSSYHHPLPLLSSASAASAERLSVHCPLAWEPSLGCGCCSGQPLQCHASSLCFVTRQHALGTEQGQGGRSTEVRQETGTQGPMLPWHSRCYPRWVLDGTHLPGTAPLLTWTDSLLSSHVQNKIQWTRMLRGP